MPERINGYAFFATLQVSKKSIEIIILIDDFALREVLLWKYKRIARPWKGGGGMMKNANMRYCCEPAIEVSSHIELENRTRWRNVCDSSLRR